MQFREIIEKEKDKWNSFILANSPDSFLQSFEWGEFQQSVGRKAYHFTIEEDGNIRAIALAIEHALPLGSRYWYLPRGPVFEKGIDDVRRKEILGSLMSDLKREAQRSGAIFVRMDPAVAKDTQDIFTSAGARLIPGSVQPKDTLVLDIDKGEEDILSQMKQKTRYNIRLAEKKGVEVAVSEAREEDLDALWNLISQTSARDGITSHGREYYAKMLSALRADDGALKARLYLARYQDRIIAANIVMRFGDYTIYLHGASSNEMRNLMAPYLLQWRQIQDAKSIGCRIYDFWGITVDDENPRWAGITRFKQGFGGREVRYAGVYDLPVNPLLYGLYSFVLKVSRHK